MPGSYLRTLAADAARLCGVPLDLFAALVERESSWRQYDRHGRVLRSSAGALGLAQLKEYHGHPLLDLGDAQTNLSLGACLLRRHYDRVRRYVSEARAWALALAAYHGGQYRKRNGPATRAYVSNVLEGSAQ